MRKYSNREREGSNSLGWQIFLHFVVVLFFLLLGGGGGGGVGGNNYTNRLKSRLSFPRIVDDYPSHVLSFRSSKANTNNVSIMAGFLSLP